LFATFCFLFTFEARSNWFKFCTIIVLIRGRALQQQNIIATFDCVVVGGRGGGGDLGHFHCESFNHYLLNYLRNVEIE